MSDLSVSTHSAGRSKSWNLLMADGSVKIVVMDSRTGRAGGGWLRLTDMLVYLEYVNAGIQKGPPVYDTDYNKFPVFVR